MPKIACPFCFSRIDSSQLAYQCTSRGGVRCQSGQDEVRARITGSMEITGHTIDPAFGRKGTATCEVCGGPAKRRACPVCHTPLPIDFLNSAAPIISILGSRGSGKTVLSTVLVRQLREVAGRDYAADIRIAHDHPNGHRSLRDYYRNVELPLFSDHMLPAGTAGFDSIGATPIILRWRQQPSGRAGASPVTTMLSLIDGSGDDVKDQEGISGLRYLDASEACIFVIDPFALPGVRARIDLPAAAIQVEDNEPVWALKRLTDKLRVAFLTARNKKIPIPVAVVVTKIDAFYSILEQGNPILATTPFPGYNDADGLAVHEWVRMLLREGKANDIEYHMATYYSSYRYFAVSALGSQPNYTRAETSPDGVQPHRVEDPILWILSKAGFIPTLKPL